MVTSTYVVNVPLFLIWHVDGSAVIKDITENRIYSYPELVF
jgi:hypothetical protein